MGQWACFVGLEEGEKRVVDRSKGRRPDGLVDTVEEIG